MPTRTQFFQKIPWTGGVNDSVDPGVLHPNDLVQADNMVATTNGTRKKREGWDYFDTAIPAVKKRSSSGTTRTIQFTASISIASPLDQILVVGEKITIAGAGNANYNSALASVASITTTNITNDTITYTFSGASLLTEALTADTAAVVSKTSTVLAVHDFWYFNSSNNAKTQLRMSVTSQGKFYYYDNNGRRKQIVTSGAGATALASTSLTSADMKTFNNKCLITMSGVGNTPKFYDPAVADEWKDLPGAPDGSFMQEHLGRIWMNDKTNPDRAHFCETFDETLWQGNGDSGAVDVGLGDGDNVGISAILPPFRGALFIAKGTRLRRISGFNPEEFQVDDLTNGVGAVSHKSAVAFDFDDVYYMSRRGVHSVVTTQNFGDFTGKFSSARIQNTFNSWNSGNLKITQATYLAPINSILFTVSEGGTTASNAIWVYNPTIQNEDGTQGIWFRWTGLNAQSICTVLQDNALRPLAGTSDGRLIIGQNGGYTDFADEAISFRVKSGAIYPAGNPQAVVGFKKIALLYKPRGRFNFSAYVKIDNLPAQTLTFDQSETGDILGETFVLGTSLLGSSRVLAPFTRNITGFGRGCTIEIAQTGIDAQVEIYGFMIEYEPAGSSDDPAEVTSAT